MNDILLLAAEEACKNEWHDTIIAIGWFVLAAIALWGIFK